MDEYFESFLESFGQPTVGVEVRPSLYDKYRGALPQKLLQYWKTYGFCSFKDGLFSIVNPYDYAPALSAWIDDTPVREQDTFHVIGRTGFGVLYLWGKKTGNLFVIDSPYGTIIEQSGGKKMIDQRGEDFALQAFFGVLDIDSCDIEDEGEKPLFVRAIKKLGLLGVNEVFAFEPALGAGGSAELKSIKKRDIHVYLSLLAQLCPREVVSASDLKRRATE